MLEYAKNIVGDYPHEVSYDMEVGHPSERIIALAKKVQADAIVIGSRGLSGIAEFFLGSVSSKVSQYAAVPVGSVSSKVSQYAAVPVLIVK